MTPIQNGELLAEGEILEGNFRPKFGGYDGRRLGLVLLSKLFAWKEALVILRPENLMRWHRRGFRHFSFRIK